MNRLLRCIYLLPLFSIFAQVTPVEIVEETNYDSTNYIRSSLFLEQDQIYGREVTFEQGLELICYQDKVKAEISSFDTMYTPVDLNNIPRGEYLIKLSKSGYSPIEFRININSEKRTSLVVNLERHMSLLKINGLPEESAVFINNHIIDPLNGEIAAGENYLRITAFGYEEYTDIIHVSGEPEYVLNPQLIKKDFKLKNLSLSRDTIWLNDSPSQKKSVISIYADAPGTGRIIIRKASNNSIVISSDLIFNRIKTNFILDLNDYNLTSEEQYNIHINGTDGTIKSEVQSAVYVKPGTKSVWRNNFTGFSGFIFTPTAETLPAGVSQIQTVISPSFTADSLYIPAIFTLRTSPVNKLEMAIGAGLYISPIQNETSLDFFASGKYRIYDNDKGFSAAVGLSLNYNGKTSSFGEIPSYDPFAGLTGLSVIIPAEYRLEKIAFHLTPEFKISPSFPGLASKGFNGGSFFIWNYFRAAISVDLGRFSAALSTAVQSPSYMESDGDWPLFLGMDLISTPGQTGFSFSVSTGLRYVKDEAIQVTGAFSAGFIF